MQLGRRPTAWLSALLGLVVVFLLVRVVALERAQRRLEARLGALSAHGR